ncbi:MAG: prolyl oligopeptidase family serine peptidase [Clostridia bacterium]|nr:prolyl oligopeptidase family serine peptidase [Clostridia bacterium]
MIEEKICSGLKYLISYPAGFRADRKYPLVVFLHGAGTRCDDTEVLKRNNCFVNLQKRQERGYILLAPLCGVHDWNEVMQTVVGIIGGVLESGFVDRARVYATGNSMGGYGTWELAAIRPEWFAAIMPVCGGGIAAFAQRLAGVPVRAFHGLRDTVVDPAESLQMAKAVNSAGGRAELILFPEAEHNCWDAVYSDESNYDWLLGCSRAEDLPGRE